MRALMVAVVASSTLALAQLNAGVSDERLSLPQAPGSIGGVGENAGTSGNQGALSYAVNVEVPRGFAGLTPELSFTYSSLGGASPLGMGWAMPAFSIERMTVKGLQKYDAADRFVVDGSTELVRVAQAGTTATYRARFEGGFVRYTWLDVGTGQAGSWKAEYPDGRVAWFGADASGAAVSTAQVRVPNSTKTFSWHLVAMEDVWGHQMKFTWVKDAGGVALLERIDYLFEGTLARHSVRLTWEARPDVQSDARPGFELRLTQRLKDVRIFSGTTSPEQVRKYVLDYEPTTTSGGASRLASVSRFGRNDLVYPVKFSFAYSKTLGGTCTTNCEKPFVASMGTLGNVDFSSGRATLVDINGDALPDVLFSSANGAHQFYYGRLDAEGRASFSTTPVASAKTVNNTSYVLGDARVQLLDVNGDGFMDLTQARLGTVLCNDGSGDWVDGPSCVGDSVPGTVALGEDADALQQDPVGIRFFDYDNDKRIDWLNTLSDTTAQVLVNGTAGITSQAVDPIGLTFDASGLQLADINGDGLQDPVDLQVSGSSVTVQSKLNLGFGVWSTAWRSVSITGFNATQAGLAELQDVNGDGLVDVVAISGNVVALALNRGDTFAPVTTIGSADLASGQVPTRGTGTTISFADMNGNGSDDIVWFQPNGAIEYLELFPVRPNLISRIDNGLGAVQLIRYGTSIAEQARDVAAGKPWPNRVPNATVLVTGLDTFVTLTGSESSGLRERKTFRYHAGSYDGVEKQFRGYEGVEQELISDLTTDSQEPGLVVLDFDVGRTDPAFAGRPRRRQVFSLRTATPALINEERTLDALCPLTDVSSEVRFVCERARTTLVVEGDLAEARTVRIETDYDGFGQVTRRAELGVVNLGTPEQPRACAACVASGSFGEPCGMTCSGDERFTQTTFITPGAATSGRWVLGRPSRVVSGAVESALQLETQTFYDGPAFVGLAAGQLTRGGVSRVSQRFGAGATERIDVTRHRIDADGNVSETREPGSTFGRTYGFDAAGLHVTRVDVALSPTRALRSEAQYDAAFELMSQTSSWVVVAGGQPAGAAQVIRYRYDDHGRLTKTLDPGDSDASPSTEYQYELGDPLSRLVTLRRSSATSGQDLVTVSCLDGRGREVQSRRKLSGTNWQVSGFTVFDARGATARTYQPWVSSTAACETAAPQGVPFASGTFDVLGRRILEVEPDGSFRRIEYGPLVRRDFDEEATDMASPRAGAHALERFDGLGRTVSFARASTSASGVPAAVTRLEYDTNGSLAVVKDPGGHPHVQRYDLLQRLVEVVDPNSGTTSFTWDEAGNEVRRVDARGVAVRSEYDALDRRVAQWNEADDANTRVTWTFDELAGCAECTQLPGRLAEVKWNGGASRFGYDTEGQLLFHERVLGAASVATRYRYDTANRRTATLYPGGLTLEQAYDGASRVTSMRSLVDRVDYGPRDRLASVTFTNGVTTSWEYDDRLRLSGLRTATASGEPVLDLGFTRSKADDLQVLTDRNTRAGHARHGVRFGVDDWRRVTSAELDGETLTAAYDSLDNVQRFTSSVAGAPAHVGDYTYDATRPNAVVGAGAMTWGYDAAGRVSTRADTTYDYDHLGRLVRATRGGEVRGEFGYGSGPERAFQREGDFLTWFVSDDFEVRDGIAVAYARLNGLRVARLESDVLAPTLLSDLAPNGRIDISDAWLAQGAATGVVTLDGSTPPSPVKDLLASAARRLLLRDVVWLHQDHLQSVVAATGAAGELLGERSFIAWGAERDSSGFVDTYGFTGQARDESTGLIHFAYRDLDPVSGRWTSVDPAFLELTPETTQLLGQSTAAYAYAANDFADSVDPTGLLGGKANSNKGKKPGLAKRLLNRLKGKVAQRRARSRTEYIDVSKLIAARPAPPTFVPPSNYIQAPPLTGGPPAYGDFVQHLYATPPPGNPYGVAYNVVVAWVPVAPSPATNSGSAAPVPHIYVGLPSSKPPTVPHVYVNVPSSQPMQHVYVNVPESQPADHPTSTASESAAVVHPYVNVPGSGY